MINPYFEKFKVRAAEIGPNGKAKFPVLINFFQEAAWQHADVLGVSVPALMEKGHTWVLHRLFLRVLRPVEKNELVEVETWPSGIEKFFTFRDMRFRNAKQELVAEGCTAWVVIDIEKRRLIPVPDYITGGNFVIENKHLPHPTDKLPSMGETIAGPEFRVYFQHLDQNKHVNNVHYLEWMLASLPQDYLLHMQVKEIDIQFKSECVLNDEIVSEFQQLSGNEILHCLREKHSQREVARAMTVWKEK
jgi:medium-chain acyl-[acyl-carrier-protein] hydrolase